MALPPFIVGPTGLPDRTSEEWRAGVVVPRWQESYGADVPTDSTTPDGFWIDALTLVVSHMGDGISSVFANSFFRTAEGPALDLVLDPFIQRLPALPTTVSLVWYGSAGTLVYSGTGPGAPVASVVTTTESNLDRYQVVEGSAGTIPLPADDGAVMVVRINAVKEANTYPVDIDAVPITVVPVAGPAETTQSIANQVAAAIRTDEPTWSVITPGLDPLGAALIVIDGKAAEVVTVGAGITDPLQMDALPAARLNAAAEVTGPQVAQAGTVITIETPAAGLDGVTTTADGDLGRDLETDPDLKLRHLDQINGTNKSSPQSIRATLLRVLPDPLVEFARVDEALDGDKTLQGAVPITIPVGTYMVTMIGTATDQQVGDQIFIQRPAGVRTFGPIQTTSTDQTGELHRTFHNRGTESYLHLLVTITGGEGFPTLGDPLDTIKAAITAGLLAQEAMGRDIIREFVAGLSSTAVPGVTNVTVRTDTTSAPGDVPVFMGADVIVPPTEVVRIDSLRIAVTMGP